ISIAVKSDAFVDGNRSFFVDLSNPVGATLARTRGTALILDDDGFSAIAVGDVTVAKGTTGTVDATFNIFMPVANSKDVMVNYTTMDGTAQASSNDYIATSGTLLIPAGQNGGQITVKVNGSVIQGLNENFFLVLSNPVNASLSRAVGTGTILDDNGSPALSNDIVPVLEGKSGTPDAAFFRITLSAPSTQNISVNYATVNGSAIGGVDYAKMSGTLLIPAGSTEVD